MKKIVHCICHNNMLTKFHYKTIEFSESTSIHCISYYRIAYTRGQNLKINSYTKELFKLLLFCILHFAKDDNVWYKNMLTNFVTLECVSVSLSER